MKNMTIEEIKKNIYYYAGIEASDEEAEEILYYCESNPRADLSAIISDYYCC